MAKKKVYKRKPYAVMEKETIEFLARAGERIIKQAYGMRRWNNQTYNLHDSFGSAVYRDGVLQTSTVKFLTPQPIADPYNNPRELGTYKGQRSKAQKGSSYTEFLKANPDGRFITGDTLIAYGRDEINKFFNNYKPTITSGLELVVVAVMYYAGILESKGYQVISSATTDMLNMAQLLGKGVEVYRLDIDRNKEEAFASKAFDVKRGQKLN